MPCPVVLTGKFPNAIASESQESDWLQYFPEPVDATMTPADLPGFRTIFTAFHHFTPDQGRAIIADAIAQRQPIAIFEFTVRSLAAILFMLADSDHLLHRDAAMSTPRSRGHPIASEVSYDVDSRRRSSPARISVIQNHDP